MARPKKCRKVCSMPDCGTFAPIDKTKNIEAIEMSIDEYEVIRLIDLEGYTQEECATQMDISRTTVTGIYTNARLKLAKMLVNGCSLSIRGGDITLCTHKQHNPKCAMALSGCCKRRLKDKKCDSETKLFID